jgi:hypothetical protein
MERSDIRGGAAIPRKGPGFRYAQSGLQTGGAGRPPPPAIIETLNREIAAIIADKGYHERMAKIGVDVVGTTADAYAKITRDDFVRWAKVTKAAGIEPQ